MCQIKQAECSCANVFDKSPVLLWRPYVKPDDLLFRIHKYLKHSGYSIGVYSVESANEFLHYFPANNSSIARNTNRKATNAMSSLMVQHYQPISSFIWLFA